MAKQSCLITKQYVFLSYRKYQNNTVTQKEIDSLLDSAIRQRDRAQRMIREHFDELEARNQATFWMKLYLVKKAEAEYWRTKKPDQANESED